MNLRCAEILAEYKSKENDNAENLIFLIDNKDMQKVAVAWKNSKVVLVDDIKNQDAINDDWTFVWMHSRYNEDQFVALTGLEKEKAIQLMNQLKELKLIYPDGTISSIVRTLIGGVMRQQIYKATGQKDKSSIKDKPKLESKKKIEGEEDAEQTEE